MTVSQRGGGVRVYSKSEEGGRVYSKPNETI